MTSPLVYTVDLNSCPVFTIPPGDLNATSVASLVAGHYYPNGIITSSITSHYDFDNKKWTTSPNDYFNSVKESAANGLLVAVSRGAGETTIAIPDMEKQYQNDSQLMRIIQDEYCFLNSRYQAYLKEFVGEIGNPTNSAKGGHLMTILKDLNGKISAFTSFIDYYVTTRISLLNAKNSGLNKLNSQIKDSVQTNLAPSTAILSDKSILNTRKEMIRYTKEKNNSIRNQISLWAALNIVAIGMIFHLYRTL